MTYPIELTLGDAVKEGPDAFQLTEWCQRAFARAWFAGDRPTAARLLTEVMRLEGERSATGKRAAEALWNLSLLQRDLKTALHAGDALLCGTGYDSLAHLARSQVALLERDAPEFAALFVPAAQAMAPRPWVELPHERENSDNPPPSPDDTELEPITSPALRWPISEPARSVVTGLADELIDIVGSMGDVCVILGDNDEGGWLQLAVAPGQVVIHAAIPPVAEQARVSRKLAEAGLTVHEDQAQMLYAPAATTGREEDLLQEVVTVSLALLEHAYGCDSPQDLRWLY